MSKPTFVIVGASLAGAKAAAELRERGFDGRVILIGAEPSPPYERPPLSKSYLMGSSERSEVFVHEDVFYEQHEIELISDHRVTKIEIDAGQVLLDDGRSIGFDKLLLTTGAEPRRLLVPGSDLDGILYLRTLADSERLRERLQKRGRVAVVGAGWIGSEVAAAARQMGHELTLIDPLTLPNERLFGQEIGAFYRDLHTQHGAELILGDGIVAFEGSGSVARAQTSSGRMIECDLVVVGIGVVPCSELAEAAGIGVDNGIIVDDKLQSSVPNLFAAGDVANAWHPSYGRRIRVEHWANALNQGPAAARAMIGDAVSYDETPYFFSDQYDVGMEYSGYATEWDEVVIRGSRDGGEFIAFWIKDDRVLAGMNVNVWDVQDQIRALIRSRAEIDTAALADRETPLEDTLRERSAR